MIPQMEKVIPAGTKRLGYLSESWPVVKLLSGRRFFVLELYNKR